MTTNEMHRVTLRMPEILYKDLEYWAARNEINVNELIIESIELMIRHQNKDYNLPVLEVARLNQLIDGMAVLSQNVQSLEHITTYGFDSLLGLTRGDNYLLEMEDGEIE